MPFSSPAPAKHGYALGETSQCALFLNAPQCATPSHTHFFSAACAIFLLRHSKDCGLHHSKHGLHDGRPCIAFSRTVEKGEGALLYWSTRLLLEKGGTVSEGGFADTHPTGLPSACPCGPWPMPAIDTGTSGTVFRSDII